MIWPREWEQKNGMKIRKMMKLLLYYYDPNFPIGSRLWSGTGKFSFFFHFSHYFTDSFILPCEIFWRKKKIVCVCSGAKEVELMKENEASCYCYVCFAMSQRDSLATKKKLFLKKFLIFLKGHRWRENENAFSSNYYC